MGIFMDGWDLISIRSVVVGLSACVILYLYLRPRSHPKNLPPGPRGWPLLGCLPQMAFSGELPQVFLSKLTARYGDVFSFYLAGKLIVVINKFATVKEAFAQHQLSGRPEFQISNQVAPGYGLGTSSGAVWTELRKFHSTVFRGLGIGKSSFEENIKTEAEFLVAEVKQQRSTAFDPKHVMDNALSNVLCTVVLGKRYDYSNPLFKELLCAASGLTEESGPGFLVEAMPIFATIPVFPFAQRYVKGMHTFYSHITRLLKEHEKVQDWDNPKDFADEYIVKCGETQESTHCGAKPTAMRPDYLKRAIGELFVAGTETTSTTIRWAMLYMMAYPEVQARAQKELDDATGRDRCPCVADKPSLPYTEAVICEIQRMSTIVPMSVPHYCMEDTKINGYNIPKDTIVMSNLWHIHNDSSVWSEPKEFRPERFLDEDGRLRHREELIPFGHGRRICVGENLARMELYVIFTHLLHHFTFKKPDDISSVSFKGNLGVTWAPLECRTCAVPRE